jgi:magnesium-transporting ATPase (P-type)
VIMFQVFYMMSSRSLRGSALALGFRGNPAVLAGIAVVALLQAAFIYAPPLQRLFGTLPLNASDLLISLLAGAVILPAVGLEKWLAGRSEEAGG